MAATEAAIPATEPEDAEGAAAPEPAKKTSLLMLVAELAIVTCFAIGAGGLFGMMVLGGGARPEAAAAHASKSRPADAVNLKPLPAIVTNLASPKGTWIRLEASIAYGSEGGDSNALAAEIGEDIVAYLRTVPLAQVEGPSGFQHLREDLNERARIRSAGKVRELVIQALVLE
jgi:flagellar FliL protein